jgi:serine protease
MRFKLISILLIMSSYQAQACLLLGPEPSFIIKFSSQQVPAFQSNKKMYAISAPNQIRFTRMKAMPNGRVIAYFKPEKQSLNLEKSAHVTCYSQQRISEMIASIKQSPDVEAVVPNFLSSTMEVLEPDVAMQWNLLSPPGGIDAKNTWVDFTKGESSTIAVMDTGIVSNQALDANVLPGVHFTNAGEFGISAAPSCDTCPGFNHGTWVAGMIAATGEPTYGETMLGVAPRSKVLPMNVFTKITSVEVCGTMPCLYSYLSDQINALEWLSGQDFLGLPAAPVTLVGVNMSMGHTSACPELVQHAFDNLQSKGLSVVVAAGNKNMDAIRSYPANCEGVISVAATGFYGERASYSNWGETITIAAPGGRQKQGTSMAAAHVSGVVALLRSINPMLDAQEVKKIMTSEPSVTPFPLTEKPCGAGIVNAYNAATEAHQLLH